MIPILLTPFDARRQNPGPVRQKQNPTLALIALASVNVISGGLYGQQSTAAPNQTRPLAEEAVEDAERRPYRARAA